MDTNETTFEQAITTTGQLLEVGGKLKPGSSIEVSAKIFKVLHTNRCIKTA